LGGAAAGVDQVACLREPRQLLPGHDQAGAAPLRAAEPRPRTGDGDGPAARCHRARGVESGTAAARLRPISAHGMMPWRPASAPSSPPAESAAIAASNWLMSHAWFAKV